MSTRYIGGLVYNPPGGWSGSFSGSGQYLTLPSGSAFAFGTGDFTVECFAYINSFPSNPGSVYFVDARNSGQTGTWAFLTSADGTNSARFDWYTGSSVINGTVLPSSTWLHLVYTRSSSTYGMFVNGIRVATGTDSTNYSVSPTTSYIASRFSASDQLNGYMSNLRVVKGSSVYSPSSTTLTVPTGALLPITNTVLLTCRYPTFVDGSASPITLTNVGTATTNTSNPFPTSVLPNPALGGAGNGIYTLSQYASLRGAGTWPAYDPYYKNVTLNLHGNGTNAAQNNTFLDSSTNNFTITRNGNTTQGTFTPYGSTWSNYFNGSSTYLSFASNAAFAVTTTADYTVEGWINFATVANGGVFQTTSNPTSATGPLWFGYYSGNLTVAQHGSATYNVSYAWTPTAGVWYHVAATRTSGTVRLFINGALVATDASTQNGVAFTQSGAAIGLVTTPSYLTGYLSNVRFVNGTSLYTAAFTPSTGSLTAVTNTVVLSCQSNRFIDNSSNNFAITTNGSPSVQRFSPFSPTTAYSTSVIGGSGYFDGSGDSLTFTANSSLSFTGDLTVEGWVYLRSYAGSSYNECTFVSLRTGLTVGTQFDWGRTGGSLGAGTIEWWANGIICSGTAGDVPLNQWVHLAWVRSGSGTNNCKIYVNGVLKAQGTNTSTLGVSSGTCYIGNSMYDQPMDGYSSNVRITNTAVYTSAFTPPTTPLTAISGTSMLLSYTNAGILDNAMMNDLETVGNAQISTSVKKYGTGSMYFDGTGDWLFAPKTADMVIPASSTFTMECWAYLTAAQNTFRMLVSEANGGSSRYLSINSTGIEAQFGGSSATSVAANYTFSQNTWYHIALVRNGTTVAIYINGQAQSVSNSTQTNAFFDVGTGMYIGRWGGSPSYEWNGYIDDLRITKGVARYTTTFTPPTSQVQDQ